MKKILMLCLLITSATELHSKNKNTQSKDELKYGTSSKKSLKKQSYSLTYDKIWFASLNRKQQIIYLKTMRKLALQITKDRKYSSNHPIINSLLSPAFARQQRVISNGYMRNVDFNSFFKDKNFGKLAPTCPAKQQPCAPYLGLKKNPSGGLPLLNCSKDNTADCRGDMDLLRQQINKCKTTSNDYCNTLNRELRESTKGVNDWCQSFKSISYCQAALKALCETKEMGVENAGSSLCPPQEINDLNGRSCQRFKSEMIEQKEKQRTDKEKSVAHNNDFWRDMGNLAKKICNGNVGDPEIIGICDVKFDNNKYTKKSVYREYNRNEKGYSQCIENKKKEKREEKTRAITNLTDKLNKQKAAKAALQQEIDKHKSDTEFVAEINNKINKLEKQTSSLEKNIQQTAEQYDKNIRKLGNHYYETCDQSEDVEHIIGDTKPLKELSEKILRKLKEGKTLETGEENLFKAVTGIAPPRFKKAFCSKNSQIFNSNNWSLDHEHPVEVKHSGDTETEKLKEQAHAAFLKMRQCKQNLKSAKETGCSFKETDDHFIIRAATPETPVMIQDKKTSRCFLIIDWEQISAATQGYDSKTKTTKINTEDGNDVHKIVDKITYKTGNPANPVRSQRYNTSLITNRYKLSTYRCDGDRATRARFVDDPELGDGPDSLTEQ